MRPHRVRGDGLMTRAEPIVCEQRQWKGLENAPDVCVCTHPIEAYESRSGPRCRCCMGAIQ